LIRHKLLHVVFHSWMRKRTPDKELQLSECFVRYLVLLITTQTLYPSVLRVTRRALRGLTAVGASNHCEPASLEDLWRSLIDVVEKRTESRRAFKDHERKVCHHEPVCISIEKSHRTKELVVQRPS
jgi:hypothetical protein